ncbi:E3 ubiquitin-protein ligase RMA1H1-like [Oryza brachyantha]|uniref:E3 ubiquitin-protein ligase RMA1H1-like n=1 Tax=Oryza brachyantha TaxID=4533 RepID=UPI001ADBF1CE|nr:E3 ubiquitin-protein ligase RMA1H1-like [Oryza brachyantha]XP_040376695.1 E3 ubiquitin-protein ligase RMA1H1-like [Oryza brachyantha]XP_040376696.1 E3 ubiquitin-protein ligase RMA1H1-like [Oryza brachyantha]XP_040376697.1 E3 ubiquitin-protein ligase RMA1H1-like [Oryza brachyantha]
MDQLCTSGSSDNGKSLVAGDEPRVRISGEVQAEAAAAAASGGGCFDCNICLDFAAEPVVTLCGHLYCWACIYEWLHTDGHGADDSSGDASSTRRPCPMCKAAVSPDTLVPLYGRGGGRSRKARSGSAIPCRPTVHRQPPVERRSDQSIDYSGGDHRHESAGPSPPGRPPWRATHHAAVASAPARFDVLYPPPPAAVGGLSMFHSTTTTTGGMLGGTALAVLPWVSRGQAPAASTYYTSPYHMSPRLRRRHMEVERSLHQIWFFLVVFAVLCLLLF